MAKPTDVYIEAADKKVFACALDWPGWCRSGKTEQLALESLSAYAARYHDVAKAAGVAFPSIAIPVLKIPPDIGGGAIFSLGTGTKSFTDGSTNGSVDGKHTTTYTFG